MRATEYLSDAGHYISDAGHKAIADETMEESLTAIPTNVLVGAAMASIGISLTFKLLGQDRHANFVGQWAPTFVGLAVLRKLIAHDKHQ